MEYHSKKEVPRISLSSKLVPGQNREYKYGIIYPTAFKRPRRKYGQPFMTRWRPDLLGSTVVFKLGMLNRVLKLMFFVGM